MAHIENERFNETFVLMVDHWDGKGYEIVKHISCCQLMEKNLKDDAFRVSVGGLSVAGRYSGKLALDTKWCARCPYCKARVQIFHSGPKKRVRSTLAKLHGKNFLSTAAEIILPP